MTQPQLDADALFDSRDGRALLKDAIGELRAHARRCASVVMAPDLRDIIPDHIQADILQQSYDVMDCVGRLTAMLLLVSQKSQLVFAPQDIRKFKKIFAVLYAHTTSATEGLMTLCLTVAETYGSTNTSPSGDGHQ
jgi:hypothetical protein